MVNIDCPSEGCRIEQHKTIGSHWIQLLEGEERPFSVGESSTYFTFGCSLGSVDCESVNLLLNELSVQKMQLRKTTLTMSMRAGTTL